MISKRFSLSGSFRDFRWALKSFKVFLALHYFSRVVQNRDVNSERLIGGRRQKKSGKGQQKARKRQKRQKKKLSKADDILAISLEAKQYVIIGNVLNPKLKVRVRRM